MRYLSRCLILVIALLDVVPVARGQTLRIEGESAAIAMLRLAAQETANAEKQLHLSIESGSTGASLGKLCRGEVAAAVGTRPMTSAERKVCGQNKVALVDLPLGMEGAVAVVNRRNDWVKELDLTQLRLAWAEGSRKAASWNDLDSAWPPTALKLYGPSPKLGLATNYRTALAAAAINERLALRADITASEVPAVIVDAVARDKAALGIVDWATYASQMKRLRAVPVVVDGKALQPTAAALRGGAYGPLAYHVNLYINVKALGAGAFPEFIHYVFDNAERLAPEAGLVALATEAYQHAGKKLDALR